MGGELQPRWSQALGVTRTPTRQELARAVASVAGLPTPTSENGELILARLAFAIQDLRAHSPHVHVVDPTELPLYDDAEVANSVHAEVLGDLTPDQERACASEFGFDNLHDGIDLAVVLTLAPLAARSGLFILWPPEAYDAPSGP